MGRGSIVAREPELQTISAFLDADPAGDRTLLLEGEPGIGKSLLWRTGMETATARGYRVLSSAAAQAETQLAFTAVRDLLGDVYDDVADELPSPQRRALAVVLLREDPAGRPAEPATVSVATLGALRLIASRTPLLLAVDDLQWVDPASADVLWYVVRRLETARADALLTRRIVEGANPSPARRWWTWAPVRWARSVAS